MRFFVEIDCNASPSLRNNPNIEVAELLTKIAANVRSGELTLGKTMSATGKEAGQIVCLAYFKKDDKTILSPLRH